jgi:hypothetical protein
MMRSARTKLAQNNTNRRFGRNKENPLKYKTSKHIDKYFKVEVSEEGVIQVEVQEEMLGSHKFTVEELKEIQSILASEVELFILKHGDSGVQKLREMRLPSAQEILMPGFSLQRRYTEAFKHKHQEFEISQ